MLQWIIMNIPENNYCRWQNYKRRVHEYGKYPTVNLFQNDVVSCDHSNKSNSHVLPNWSTTDLATTRGRHPFLANIKTNNMCIFNILKCLNKYFKNSWVYMVYKGLWSFSILTFQWDTKIWPNIGGVLPFAKNVPRFGPEKTPKYPQHHPQ